MESVESIRPSPTAYYKALVALGRPLLVSTNVAHGTALADMSLKGTNPDALPLPTVARTEDETGPLRSSAGKVEHG